MNTTSLHVVRNTITALQELEKNIMSQGSSASHAVNANTLLGDQPHTQLVPVVQRELVAKVSIQVPSTDPLHPMITKTTILHIEDGETFVTFIDRVNHGTVASADGEVVEVAFIYINNTVWVEPELKTETAE